MQFLYLFMVLAGMAVFGRLIHIQFVQGPYWRDKAASLTSVMQKIEAARGNIIADDGSYLAISLPQYELRMDLLAPGISEELFREEIDSLALGLAKITGQNSYGQFKQKLKKARAEGNRYLLVAKGLRFTQVKEIQQLPILSLGRNSGGCIIESYTSRKKPYGSLAARTIGKPNEDGHGVGIELAYDAYLKGKEGLRLMEKLSGSVWRPAESENTVEPEDGLDIVSTIQPDIQEVVQYELAFQLAKNDAEHGTAIVMETKTGYVRAIVNLMRGKDGNYYEAYNYAVGESTEPGSTMKLMTMLALLEDGLIKLSDSIETGNGRYAFYDHVLRDSKEGGHGTITIQHAFEVSSNIAMARLVWDAYKEQPDRFIQHFKRLGLDQPMGLEIPGEGKPLVKSPGHETWSGLTLPMMAIGYELQHTPLHVLALYNAIANNGTMMKPRFVQEIRKRGKTVERFEPEVLNKKICSEATLKALQQLLEGVVEHGTAKNLNDHAIRIAGKTGTVRIAQGTEGYRVDGNIAYKASFCGYFPAEDPSYSCMVMVSSPSKEGYYGNVVAGPVFRAVADQVYASSYKINRYHYGKPAELVKNRQIAAAAGAYEDLNTLSRSMRLQIARIGELPQSPEPIMPNLIGLGMRDAVYACAQKGLIAKTNGRGRVVEQNPKPGAPLQESQTIYLKLSL